MQRVNFFKRKHLVEIAEVSLARAVIASVVWGFPRGGRPGGKYLDFVRLFDRAGDLALELEELRSRPRSAAEGLEAIKSEGVGFATTSKIVYFAGVSFQEGPALIFDANVIKTLVAGTGIASLGFESTKACLGSGKSYDKAASAYSVYVKEATALAARLSEGLKRPVDPDQIETALFLASVRPGVWGWENEPVEQI